MLLLLAAHGLAAETAAKPPARLAAPSPEAQPDWIERYNGRTLGAPGWRRVRIDLLAEGVVTRSFTVLNAWRQDLQGGVQALYFLEAPQPLRGTAYLETERASNSPDLSVHLFLPAGRRAVLAVAPETFGEGLLGSDFSYEDVRLLASRAGVRYRQVGAGRLLGRRAVLIEALRAPPLQASQWKRALLYVDEREPFLLGADFESARGLKRLRVEAIGRVGAVPTATRQLMTTGDGRATRMTLLDMHVDAAEVDARWFAPSALPSLEQALGRLGRSPAKAAR